MRNSILKIFEGHDDFMIWLLSNGWKWKCTCCCCVVFYRENSYIIVTWDPRHETYDKIGYASFTDQIDEWELAGCNTVIEVKRGHIWYSIDELAVDDNGSIVHVDETCLAAGKTETDREEKEFSRGESIIIESFLDLYCHDCPDKECEGCRVSDLFAYLDDMGDMDEDR